MPTAYHSKYIAYDLTKQAPPGDADQLSMSLFDASVDLNPHQIEAAMFALQSPISEGAILADEVGGAVSLTLKVLHFDGYKPLVEQAFYEATFV